MKTCNKCSIEKPLTDFYRDKQFRDGRASICKKCKNLSTELWRVENREKYNRDMRAYNKKYYQKGRLRRYKIKPEQYNELLKKQNGACALCDKIPNTRRPLAIDHCHKTGRVRGLLCYSCNRHLVGIDNEAFLTRALKYISIEFTKDGPLAKDGL